MDDRERTGWVRRGGLVAGVLAAGLVLASCGAAVEEATEQALESATGGGDVELGDDGVRVTDEEGNELAFGAEASLPEGWPDDVPVPEGEIVSSTTFDDAMALSVQGEGDVAATFNDLKSQLEASGYVVEFSNEGTGFKSVSMFQGTGAEGSSQGTTATLTVAEDGEGGLSIAMNVQPRS